MDADGALTMPTTLDACRARYCTNLRALYATDPGLASSIDRLPFSTLPALEPTRDAGFTVQLPSDAGPSVYVHSRYRPLEEAQRLVAARMEKPPETLPTGAAEGNADHSDDGAAVVLFGLGLGYHIVACERTALRPTIVVCEPDLHLIKLALCLFELHDQLDSGRLRFVTTTEKGAIHERLKLISTTLMLGTRYVVLPHAARCRVDEFTRFQALVTDYISFARTQLVTALRNSRITFENIINNLPSYLNEPGIEAFAGRGRGFPAVLIAAGPSLSRQLPLLREIQDRAVLIAVQTVLKPLLQQGIRPHFVASLDYHEISAQFYSDLADVQDCALIAEPKVAWQVPDAYPGRVHMLHARVLDDLLGEQLPRRGALKAGGTVAHLAYYFAEHLACNPIVLVGQDLAFSDGMYYAPGMPVEASWQPESSRYQTVEMRQWERIIRIRPILRKVPDSRDGLVYTDEPMFTYAEQFEADFAQTDTRIINTSASGRTLGGTELLPLESVVEQYCRQPLGADQLRVDFRAPSAPRRTAIAAALEERLDELAEVRSISERMETLLAELEDLFDQPDRFNRLIGDVDELRVRMQAHEALYRVVTSIAQLAEYRRIRADRQLEDNDSAAESTVVARLRLRRDRNFVRDFLEGCAFLEQTIPKAIDRLRGGVV